MQRSTINKTSIPNINPSKSNIFNWLKSLLPDIPFSLKIEDLGDGVIYCRLLSYFTNNPPKSKIILKPKSQHEFISNLKQMQNVLQQLSINITFDISKISKKKYKDNWDLIAAFYKHFNTNVNETPQDHQYQSKSVYSHRARSVIRSNLTSSHHPINQSPQPSQRSHPYRQPKVYYESPQQYSKQTPSNTFQALQPISTTNYNKSAELAQKANDSLQMTKYLNTIVNASNISPTKQKAPLQKLQSNSNTAIVERIKQILLNKSADTQKIKNIKQVIGLPVQQQQIVKIQDQMNNNYVISAQLQNQSTQNLQFKINSDNNETSSKYYQKDKSSNNKINKQFFKL